MSGCQSTSACTVYVSLVNGSPQVYLDLAWRRYSVATRYASDPLNILRYSRGHSYRQGQHKHGEQAKQQGCRVKSVPGAQPYAPERQIPCSTQSIILDRSCRDGLDQRMNELLDVVM